MNKEEFLKSLESKLEVLNKREREDILSEYEQHIELRMKSGLSEEGAIKDFGNLDELVKEILEAYNVDPEYGKKKNSFSGEIAGEAVTKNVAAAGKQLRKIGGAFKNVLLAFGRIIKKAVSRCLVFCLLPLKKIKVWFAHRKEEKTNLHNDHAEEKIMEKSRIQTVGRKIWKLFLWCCLLGLKCLVLAVIWPVVIGEILGVVGFGALIVFLFMGYPVWGLTIMTAGCLAAGWAILWLTKEILFLKLKGTGRKDERIYREEEACRA